MTALRTLHTALPCALLLLSKAGAAGDPRAAEVLTAQARAMAPLARFAGLWRGPAKVSLPDGSSVLVALDQTREGQAILKRVGIGGIEEHNPRVLAELLQWLDV